MAQSRLANANGWRVEQPLAGYEVIENAMPFRNTAVQPVFHKDLSETPACDALPLERRTIGPNPLRVGRYTFDAFKVLND